MHEQFAQEIARLSEHDALGKPGEDAYVAVGFARHRHNHIRLLRRERVAKRVAWLRIEREAAAQAARMSPAKVIEELHARGIGIGATWRSLSPRGPQLEGETDPNKPEPDSRPPRVASPLVMVSFDVVGNSRSVPQHGSVLKRSRHVILKARLGRSPNEQHHDARHPERRSY